MAVSESDLRQLVALLPALRRIVANDTTLQRAAGISETLTTDGQQTITGEKTFNAPVKVADASGSGTILHAFGSS